MNKYRNHFFIVGIILLVHGYSVSFQFSPLDDSQLFADKIGWLSDISNIPAIFTATLEAGVEPTPFYRPVLVLSFMLDAIIGNGSPISYHLTNILLHILVTLGIYIGMMALLKHPISALFWSLFFALHPLLTSAVSWIPGRNDTMITLMALLSIYFLHKYLSVMKNKWLVLNIFFLLLAVFTKEQMIFLPIIFVSIIIFLNLEKWEIFPLSIIWIFSVLLFLLVRSHFVTGSLTINIPDKFEYIKNLVSALIISTGKLVIPLKQSVMPTFEIQSIIPGTIIILVIIFSIYRWGLKDRNIFYLGLIWYLSMVLIPLFWGTILDEQFEHRMYFPLVGFIIMLSQLNIMHISLNSKNLMVLNFLLVFLILFGLKAHFRSYVYEDELSFGLAAINDSPLHSRSYKLLGDIYRLKNQPDLALDNYNIAIAIDANAADTYNNRGDIFLKQKLYQIAVDEFTNALLINPNYHLARNNRAVAYYFLKNYEMSNQDLQIVIASGFKAHPDFISALNQALESSQ
jgi:protein O-mannosyl-transferase